MAHHDGMSPEPTTPVLGRLRAVAPRDIWPHEALHFTPWLLGNVDVLSDLLGMDLVLEEAEHPVGGFSLDLKGFDESTGETVIVENQLDGSDHTHLGQIITYAAGTDPTTVVWVAASFRPEHRAAIDWLNQRTDEGTRFFGVVVKVVQIGDSVPAPSFELAAAPNDWRKQVKAATSAPSNELSESQRRFQEFWELVLDRVREVEPTWTRARTSRASWIDVPTGVTGAAHSLQWVAGRLVCQLYLGSSDPDLNRRRFDHFLRERQAFEAALGTSAQWDAMEGRKATRIIVPSPFEDIDQRDRWTEMADWLVACIRRFKAAEATVGGIPT
jgi:hypothetical protein